MTKRCKDEHENGKSKTSTKRRKTNTFFQIQKHYNYIIYSRHTTINKTPIICNRRKIKTRRGQNNAEGKHKNSNKKTKRNLSVNKETHNYHFLAQTDSDPLQRRSERLKTD